MYLAGDYLKEASDSNVDLCAVGFLYRYGYFTQTLSMDGQQIANYEAQNFGQLPIDRVTDADGKPLVVDVPYMDYYVHANVWRVNVGTRDPAGYRRYADTEGIGYQKRYLSL